MLLPAKARRGSRRCRGPRQGGALGLEWLEERTAPAVFLVSTAPDGSPGRGPAYNPRISADGRHVGFVSPASNLVSGDTNGRFDVFVRDLRLGVTTLVSAAPDGSPANNSSNYPSISADGLSVAFESTASNLVSGDTNGHS